MNDEADDKGDAPKALEPASNVPATQAVESNDKQDLKTEDSDEEDLSALREWFELVTRAGFWALVLYLFVFQVSVVQGPSMQPNFVDEDRLVIDKVSYMVSSVKRFDVVVFQAMDMDAAWGTRENKDYIKRVIGLQGEVIGIRAGKIYVNGTLLTENFSTNPISAFYHANDEFTVPPHHFFVMGDNRGNSKDSRSSGLGYVSEAQIRGLVRVRFFPLSRMKWFGRGE